MMTVNASRLLTHLRLLPVLMLVAVLLLGIKIRDIINQFSDSPTTIGRAALAEAPAKAPTTDSAPTPAAADSPAEAAGALPDEAPKPPATSGATSLIDITEFSASEISLLQSLRDRREQLLQQEAELKNRERVLLGLEQRIDNKLEELRSLQQYIEGVKADIVTLSEQFKKNEDERIKSLVRVYEKMKPKEAARIFDNLELTILLDVVKRMNESRLAPILAEMDPNKATIITTKLGKRETLPTVEN